MYLLFKEYMWEDLVLMEWCGLYGKVWGALWFTIQLHHSTAVQFIHTSCIGTICCLLSAVCSHHFYPRPPPRPRPPPPPLLPPSASPLNFHGSGSPCTRACKYIKTHPLHSHYSYCSAHVNIQHVFLTTNNAV
jgi:hypothetical protein